jgi:hypothetical protein
MLLFSKGYRKNKPLTYGEYALVRKFEYARTIISQPRNGKPVTLLVGGLVTRLQWWLADTVPVPGIAVCVRPSSAVAGTRGSCLTPPQQAAHPGSAASPTRIY